MVRATKVNFGWKLGLFIMASVNHSPARNKKSTTALLAPPPPPSPLLPPPLPPQLPPPLPPPALPQPPPPPPKGQFCSESCEGVEPEIELSFPKPELKLLSHCQCTKN